MIIRISRSQRAWLEKVYASLVLFMMTRPLLAVFQVGGIDIQMLLIMVAFIHPALYVARHWRGFWRLMRWDKLLMLLVFWAVASVSWSVAPNRTAISSLNLLAGTFFGVYLALRYRLRDQITIIAVALAIGAVSSVAVALLAPSLGRHTARGSIEVWSGVYLHKNGLGRYMAICAVGFWLLATERWYRWWHWALFGLAVMLIVLASSGTALLTVIALLCLMPFYRQLRKRQPAARLLPYTIIGIGLTLTLWLLFPDLNRAFDTMLILLGRDPDRNSLLVRLALWEFVWEHIRERPFMGYGFDAFWFEGDVKLLYYNNNATGWPVEQAHNGFLELWLQLGVIGLIGMVLHLLRTLWRALGIVRHVDRLEGMWVLSYLTILLLFSSTYSVLLGQLTVPWTLYVAVTLSICIQRALRLRGRPTAPPQEHHHLHPTKTAG